MLKLPDIAGVNPVSRVMPLLVVESIGSIAQELGDRATQLVKGQAYFAHVLAKVSDTTYTVKVEGTDIKGEALKDIVLKMDLGNTAKAGQTLSLRYMHSDPVTTFLLTPPPSNIAGSTTEISAAANLIGNLLKQAESEGVPSRLQAVDVITQSPNNPKVMAQDLKHAVSSSGLFYESHLSDLLQGNQTLAALKQEPQNQLNPPIAGLMSQQLAVLENQRMSWQGEVWPGQAMNWDVYLQPENVTDEGDQAQANAGNAGEDRPISSEMTLHLPNLGTVSAKLILIDGRMRINIIADQSTTLETLRNQRRSLAEAITKNGQQLDTLTVVSHE